MAKVGFELDIEEVKKSFGMKDGKKEEDSIKKEGEEEDTELASLDSQAEERAKKLKKRLLWFLIILPILAMFTKVIIMTIIDINTEERTVPKVEKTVDVEDLKFDKEFTWKILTDQSIEKISKQVDSIKTEVKEELNSTVNLIKDELQKNNIHMQKVVETIKENNKEFQNNMLKFTLEEIQKLDEKFEKKLKNIKVTDIKQQVISLNSLPKLRTLNDSKDSDKEKELAEKAKKILPPLKLDSNETNVSEEEEETKVEIVYDDIDIGDSINDSYVIEAEIEEEKKDEKKEYPTFTLMPGFIKGVLVNGSRVSAFLNGNSEPAPIFIRLTGRELIPNDDSVNIDGCLILATAKSDLSKKTVDIRLSKMTCSLTDIDGNKYKMDSSVQGWVFSENGQFGIPGRLITRESEILKAGLPLAIVEGMINTLTNVLNKQYTNTVGGQDYYTVNPMQGLVQGAGKTSETILQKYTDYYMKMLDALNPVIEIRAGREVTIAFKGGEQLKIEPYNDVDTGYFANQIDEVE